MTIAKGTLLAGALLLWAAAAQAGEQDFTLLNETGYQIDRLYISSTKTNQWEEDILGEDPLPTGESVEIEFDAEENQCRWDIKAVYDDGEPVVWTGVDLCSLHRITLYYSQSDGKTTAVGE